MAGTFVRLPICLNTDHFFARQIGKQVDDGTRTLSEYRFNCEPNQFMKKAFRWRKNLNTSGTGVIQRSDIVVTWG